MGKVIVNRTGSIIPVYADNNFSVKSGSIYPNELFTLVSLFDEADIGICYIYFRNSAKVGVHGYISAGPGHKNIQPSNYVHNFAKFTKVMSGKTCYGFELLRSEELYNGSGKPLNKVAALGRKFLCEDSTSGATIHNLMRIQYLETNIGSNVYERLVTGGDAFIDVGYNAGSTMGHNASFIGSI